MERCNGNGKTKIRKQVMAKKVKKPTTFQKPVKKKVSVKKQAIKEEVVEKVVEKQLNGELSYSGGVLKYQDIDNSGMKYEGDLEGFIRYVKNV